MHSQDLFLLLLGSFLPNNIFIWLYKATKRKLSTEEHSIKLISPRKYYAKFESDPKVQYNYHRKMQKFWMANFLPIIFLLSLDIYGSLGHLSVKFENIILVVMLGLNTIYSLYANWDTETGDAHAAYASIRTDEIQAGTGLPEDQINNIVDQVEAWSLPEV